MTTVTLAPWLVEESHHYYLAANLLRNEPNLLGVAEINAALSLEILFKSFLVIATEYRIGDVLKIQGPSLGTMFERYRYTKPKKDPNHSLYHLYLQLPEQVKIALFDYQKIIDPNESTYNYIVSCLEKYGETYTKSRYRYEPQSNKGFRPTLINIAAELIPKTIKFYRDNGCTDPWILRYPNV